MPRKLKVDISFLSVKTAVNKCGRERMFTIMMIMVILIISCVLQFT